MTELQEVNNNVWRCMFRNNSASTCAVSDDSYTHNI